LKIIREDVQAVTDIERINSIFEDTTKRLAESDTLIYYLVLRRFGFDDNFLTKNRQSLNITTIESIMKNNEYKIQRIEQEQQEGKYKRKASYVKNTSLECFPDWPLCIYDLNYKYHIVEFLIFKVHDPPLIIENYFFDIVNQLRTLSFTKVLRKKSKSSETTHKMEKLDKGHRNSLLSSKTLVYEDSDQDFYDQLDCYYNLLIERRPHCCNKGDDISSTTSVIIDADNSVFEQNEIENSFIEIRNSLMETSR
jgi:hypothetical protein